MCTESVFLNLKRQYFVSMFRIGRARIKGSVVSGKKHFARWRASLSLCYSMFDFFVGRPAPSNLKTSVPVPVPSSHQRQHQDMLMVHQMELDWKQVCTSGVPIQLISKTRPNQRRLQHPDRHQGIQFPSRLSQTRSFRGTRNGRLGMDVCR